MTSAFRQDGDREKPEIGHARLLEPTRPGSRVDLDLASGVGLETVNGNGRDTGQLAPKPVFDQMLTWYVVPTFDLILEFSDGVFMGRRRYSPYKGKWALPGLRMLKGETIDSCLERIAAQEAGVRIDGSSRTLLGQAAPRFSSEHARQDLATCYVLPVSSDQEPTPNAEHFSGWRLVSKYEDIPPSTGSLYNSFLRDYFGY